MSFFRDEALATRSVASYGEPLRRTFNASAAFGGLVVVALAILVGVAAVVPVTRRVAVRGTIAPEGGLIEVTAPEGGVVKSVYVQEGQTVTAGERLFSLSLSGDAAGREHVTSSVLESMRQRRDSTRQQSEITSSTRTRNRELVRAKLESLDQEQRAVSEEQQLLRGKYSRLQDTVAIVGTLQITGTVSKLQLRDYEDRLTDLHVQSLQVEQKKRQLARDADDAKATLAAIDLEATRDERQLQRDGLELDERLLAESSRSEFDVTATRTGVISAAAAVAGQSVTAHQFLCVIVPNAARWTAQLRLPQQLGKRVYAGQSVVVRDPSDPLMDRNFHSGHIRWVSQAALHATVVPAGTDASTFLVEAELDDATGLRPGLAVDAKIELETHTVLAWLFAPLLRFDTKR